MGGRSYRQVLRERRLAVLLAGDALSKAGDGMVVVALPLETLRIHGRFSAALAIALIEAAPYALPVALSLTFGLGRRRYRPRLLMVGDCVLRGAVFCFLGVLAMTGGLPLWLLGVALFVGSPLRLLAVSSRRLVATGMVDEGGRFAVNGLLGTSDSVAAWTVGPALGGVLATAASPGLVLLLDGVSFAPLLAAVLLVAPVSGPLEQPGAATASGWRILREAPLVARLFVVEIVFNLFYGPVEVALPLLTRGPLHAGGAALGEIWTAFGVGAVVGAVATDQLRRVPHAALLVAIIAGWGGAVAALAIAPSVPVAAAAFALGGAIYAPFTPVAYSLVQCMLRPSGQQPVITLWAAGATVAVPVGLALGGPLVQASGARGGLYVSAALTLALVPVAGSVLRRAGSTDHVSVGVEP